MLVGHVASLARYPVKSMAGESPTTARVDERGFVGDRRWAVYTDDGGIGSGKTTRRFRRVDGLLDLRARLDDSADDVPLVQFRDGSEHRADLPSTSERLSGLLDRRLRLAPETTVPHHDESPVHVITTASLRHLGRLSQAPVQAARFRANVVIDVSGTGFLEDEWTGYQLALGEEVVLRLGSGMPRCVMVDMAQPQDHVAGAGRFLTTLGRAHALEFGLLADVVRTGSVTLGDPAVLVR